MKQKRTRADAKAIKITYTRKLGDIEDAYRKEMNERLAAEWPNAAISFRHGAMNSFLIDGVFSSVIENMHSEVLFGVSQTG